MRVGDGSGEEVPRRGRGRSQRRSERRGGRDKRGRGWVKGESREEEGEEV